MLPLPFLAGLVNYIDVQYGGKAMVLSVIILIPVYGFYCYGFSKRIKPTGLSQESA
jgi:hypothetical protein